MTVTAFIELHLSHESITSFVNHSGMTLADQVMFRHHGLDETSKENSKYKKQSTDERIFCNF